MKKISTTALSKILDLDTRDVFDKMAGQKLMYRKDDHWHLTKKGQEFGGETVFNKKYGEFIVWPENFDPFNLKEDNRQELVGATAIGARFDLSPQRINLILTEIGWTEKAIKGWAVTSLGRSVGGVQVEHPSGGSYVKWPSTIVNNSTLNRSLHHKESYDEQEDKQGTETTLQSNSDNYRDKFPGKIWTKDGHKVKSRGEAIIDNALYDYGLAHAYERRLPIEEEVRSDFYIPSANGDKAVYIEYWGVEDEPKYEERKTVKTEIYTKYDFNLIELDNKHIENLDDHLPRMLLRVGVRVE